jgi:hypothetical protein
MAKYETPEVDVSQPSGDPDAHPPMEPDPIYPQKQDGIYFNFVDPPTIEEMTESGAIIEKIHNEGIDELATQYAREQLRGRTLDMLERQLAFLEYLASMPEVHEALEGALDQWFSTLGEAMDHKLDAYVARIGALESRAAERKKRESALCQLRRSDERSAEELKERLKLFLISRGMRKVETVEHRLGVRNNGGATPLEWKVEKYDLLPKPFVEPVTTYRPKTEEIRRVLAEGAPLRARQERMECVQQAALDLDSPEGHDLVQAIVNHEAEKWGGNRTQRRKQVRSAFEQGPDAFYTEAWAGIIDAHYPPSAEEKLLGYVALGERGTHLRIE